MSENEEKQPVILTVVNAGTPDFPRYVIANQFLQYFTGNGWTDQKSERGALVYQDANDALVSFGAPKPATHRRPKPATAWGVLDGRILLFEPVGKGA